MYRELKNLYNKSKKHYTKLNTFIPLLVGVLLYIIPFDREYIWGYSRNWYEYKFLYESNNTYLFYMLSLLFVIIVINWTYKVFSIPLRIFYVINLVLYMLLIIVFLVLFANVAFYFPMLIPILPVLYAILQTKSLIDEVANNKIEK